MKFTTAWMLVALMAVAVPARGETPDRWDSYFTSGDGPEEGTATEADDPVSWGRWAAVNLALLVLLGTAYAYTRKKKKKAPWSRWFRHSRDERDEAAMGVAATLSLGNGQSIHLVEGSDFRVLVGSWSGGMASLGSVPPGPEARSSAQFPVLLEKTTRREPAGPPAREASEADRRALTEQVLSQVRQLRSGTGLLLLTGLGIALGTPLAAWAAPDALGMGNLLGSFASAEGSEWIETGLLALGILTVLAVAPAMLITLTSFTRLIIVFAFLRQALGTQNTPPNQVLIGLSLFLTFFIMAPTFEQMKADALDPYMADEIDLEVAIERGAVPLREFMFRQTRIQDLELMVENHPGPRPETREAVPMAALVPAFMISELRTAFEIGFLLYVPFLIVDLIVSTVLLAMGMMVLPPIIISLPFKILLFLLVDGWNVLVGSLVMGFS